MLLIFGMTQFLCTVYQMTFASISTEALKYYKIPLRSSWKINSLAITYMVANVPMSLISSFVMKKHGLKSSVFIAVLFNFIGGCIRLIGFRKGQELYFWILFSGQCITALAQPFVSNATTVLASKWFGEKERTTATTIATFLSILGSAFIFGVGPVVIGEDNSETGMATLLGAEALLAAVILILFVIMFREKPPTPPTLGHHHHHHHGHHHHSRVHGHDEEKEQQNRYRNVITFDPTAHVAVHESITSREDDLILANNNNNGGGGGGNHRQATKIDVKQQYGTYGTMTNSNVNVNANVNDIENDLDSDTNSDRSGSSGSSGSSGTGTDTESSLSEVAPSKITIPIGPSVVHMEPNSFAKDFWVVIKNIHFLFLVVSYSLGFAVIQSFAVMLDQIIVPMGYSIKDGSIFGIIVVCTGMFGAVIMGLVADYTKRYKLLLCLSGLGGCASFAWFAINMLRHRTTIGMVMSCISIALLGFFACPTVPLTLELSVETSFPMPENVSASILNACSTLVSAVCVLSLDMVKKDSKTGSMQSALWICLGLLGVAIIPMFLFGSPYKRMEYEKQKRLQHNSQYTS